MRGVRGLVLLALVGCGGQNSKLLASLADDSGAACPGVPMVAWPDQEVVAFDLGLDGTTLYQFGWEVGSNPVADAAGVFEVLDISDLENIQRKGRVAVTVEPLEASIHPMGSVVVLAFHDYSVDGHHRVAAIDVSDPEAPAILSVLDLGDVLGDPQFVDDGDRLFVGGVPGVDAIDFSDPANPVVHEWSEPSLGAVAVWDGVLAVQNGRAVTLYQLDATMGPYSPLASVPVESHMDELRGTPTGFLGYGYDRVMFVDHSGIEPSTEVQLSALGYVFESGPQGDGVVLAHEAPGQDSLGLTWIDTSSGGPEVAVEYIPTNVDFFSPVGQGDLVWVSAFRDSKMYFDGLVAVDMSPCN